MTSYCLTSSSLNSAVHFETELHLSPIESPLLFELPGLCFIWLVLLTSSLFEPHLSTPWEGVLSSPDSAPWHLLSPEFYQHWIDSFALNISYQKITIEIIFKFFCKSMTSVNLLWDPFLLFFLYCFCEFYLTPVGLQPYHVSLHEQTLSHLFSSSTSGQDCPCLFIFFCCLFVCVWEIIFY